MRLTAFVKRIPKDVLMIPVFKEVWKIIGIYLYHHYDTTKDFLPQFETNIANMWQAIDEIDQGIIQPYMRRAV